MTIIHRARLFIREKVYLVRRDKHTSVRFVSRKMINRLGAAGHSLPFSSSSPVVYVQFFVKTIASILLPKIRNSTLLLFLGKKIDGEMGGLLLKNKTLRKKTKGEKGRNNLASSLRGWRCFAAVMYCLLPFFLLECIRVCVYCSMRIRFKSLAPCSFLKMIPKFSTVLSCRLSFFCLPPQSLSDPPPLDPDLDLDLDLEREAGDLERLPPPFPPPFLSSPLRGERERDLERLRDLERESRPPPLRSRLRSRLRDLQKRKGKKKVI